ncbi:MAG: chromatin protein Cren7 [Candidatus Nezhaarchaeales archaeon]
MARCPNCGAEIEKPIKTWELAPKGKKPITIGLFKCPGCGKYFRAKV